MNSYQIKAGSWAELNIVAKEIREQVFIQEQNIEPEDEWDELDSESLHFIVYEDNHAIATARLLKNNSIGRVAVLKAYRGLGIGKILMEYIIQYALNENREYLKLSAQTYAIPFYSKLGFNVQGSEYLDCGIPHINMFKNL